MKNQRDVGAPHGGSESIDGAGSPVQILSQVPGGGLLPFRFHCSCKLSACWISLSSMFECLV